MIPPKLMIFDLDGTLYRGSEGVPGAADAVAAILARGIQVRYLTNNSAAEPRAVSEKLAALGIPSREEWVASTGAAAAKAAAERGARSAFVVGEPSLHAMFRACGVSSSDDSAGLVVTGICRSLTYDLLDRCLQPLLAGAWWIATNRDGSYPLEKGRIQPGAGAVVAALAAASGREPDQTLGKPEPGMVWEICREAGIEPSEALVVGDREDTDMECGRRSGCPTWMVLTGVTKELPQGQPGSDDLLGLVEALKG